jgi:hypothetical protein
MPLAVQVKDVKFVNCVISIEPESLGEDVPQLIDVIYAGD